MKIRPNIAVIILAYSSITSQTTIAFYYKNINN